MSRRLLVLSTLTCASLLALGAVAALACEHGATACCAGKAKAAHAASAYVPLPSVALPTVSAAVPMLPTAAPQPFVSGLRAFLDPETGLLTSPIGLLQAPVDLQTPEQDFSNLPQIQRANGSWELDTSGILYDIVMTIDALGHRAITHSREKQAAIAPIITPNVAPFAER